MIAWLAFAIIGLGAAPIAVAAQPAAATTTPTTAAPAAVAAAGSPVPPDLCAEAARLTKAKSPDKALALLDAFDKAIPESDRPSCPNERSAALVSASVTDSTTPPAKQKSWPEQLSGSWTGVLTSITPLQNIALGLIGWLIVGWLLLQLGPLARHNRGLDPASHRLSGSQPWGWTLILLGGVISIGCGLVGPPVQGFGLAAGVLTSLVGVWLLDLWRRGQRRLNVIVSGETGAVSATEIRGTIADLGASGPRGIDMPSGVDTSAFTDLSFGVIDGTPWVKALKTLLESIKPYSPWQLDVQVISEDRFTLTLSRNRAVLAQEFLDRSRLGLDGASLADAGSTPGDSDKTSSAPGGATVPTLWAFPAALAILQMAQAHDLRAGLGGATSWRSIAYQHIATTQLGSLKAAQLQVLGLAVDLDPPLSGAATAATTEDADTTQRGSAEPDRHGANGNMFAQFSYWSATYRRVDDADGLATYKRLLDNFIQRLDALPAGQREVALELRARYALVAILINLAHSAPRPVPVDGGGVDTGGMIDAFVKLQSLCQTLSTDDSDKVRGFVATVQGLLPTLEISVKKASGQTPPVLGLVGGGPRTHYSTACAIVPFLTAPGDDEAADAVRHLIVADQVPALRAFHDQDPQLTELRKTNAYRDTYGDPVPTDLLTIEPFASYAMVLKPLGLTSAAVIARCTLGRIPSIPIDEWRFIQQVATLARQLSLGPLGTWTVPVTAFLQTQGVTDVNNVSDVQLNAMKQAVEGLKERPADETWRQVFPSEAT